MTRGWPEGVRIPRAFARRQGKIYRRDLRVSCSCEESPLDPPKQGSLVLVVKVTEVLGKTIWSQVGEKLIHPCPIRVAPSRGPVSGNIHHCPEGFSRSVLEPW